MPRLRIRIELNRGGVGVPLQKLARVVDEAQLFFRMLGEDVHIDKNAGEWLGSDFDNKSLNFTAEYVGPVEAPQIREFYSAFEGVTLMRRTTIAQFARIADAIGEDELIGFGLYQNDEESEPSEWRSLSKRDALRITEEIRLLVDRTGDSGVESRLPAVLDPSAAANMFKDRREHAGLAERVARLEAEMNRHTEDIQTLRGTTANTEQNLQNLLLAVDAFCDRASKQMERLPAPPTPIEGSHPIEESRKFRWQIPVTVAALLALGGLALFYGSVEPRQPTTRVEAADPVASAPAPIAAPEHPKATAPPATKPLRVELKALEPTWIAVYIDEKQSFAKLLDTGKTTTIDNSGKILVRLGNAGGVEITANGKPVGPFGQKGQVKMIEFTSDGSRTVPLDSVKRPS